MVVAAVLAGGLAPHTAPAIPSGRWVPGDLHLHTTYSANVCRVPPVPNNCDPDHDGSAGSFDDIGSEPIERMKQAEERGLAFIAFTDHDTPNTTTVPPQGSAQTDPKIVAYKTCYENPDNPAFPCPDGLQGTVLIIDGQEKILSNAAGYSGNAGVIGYAGSFPPDPTPGDLAWTPSDLKNRFLQIRNAGGLVLAYRPQNPRWAYDPTDVLLDGYETWNGPWVDQSEFASGASDDPQADEAWQSAVSALALQGKRLPVVGGSDARLVATDQIRGPGQPTLWLYDTLDPPTARVSWAGIKDAIKNGRSMISIDTPARSAPRLYLETADGALMVGDGVPKGTTRSVRVRWDRAPIGATIRIVTAGGQQAGSLIQVTAPEGQSPFNFTLQFNAGRWYRAEMYLEDLAEPLAGPPGQLPSRKNASCLPSSPNPNPCFRDRYLMLAITGAIYAAP